MAEQSLLQRARGHLLVEVRRRGSDTVLADLRQDGCMKARFPRPVDWMEIVTLNSSGGIAGGDRVSSRLAVGCGAQATFASQAAERFYRALAQDPPAHVRTHITVGTDAEAEWLPQETILFDRCAMDRMLEVDVAAGGRFLGVEALVFGRSAMGETVATARLADTIRIRIAGRLVLHDAIRVQGEVAPALARRAVGGGGGAVATIVLAADDAAASVDTVRAALAPFEAGVSAWDGLLVARILGADGACIRAAIVAGLSALRGGRALPRVWSC